MSQSRREFLMTSAKAGATAQLLMLAGLFQQAAAAEGRVMSIEEASAKAKTAHDTLNEVIGPNMRGKEQIGMLVYPDMTMLDLVGPQYFFASLMGASVHLVSKDPELTPVKGDTGFSIVPTMSMADCPKDLDVLFVPGGLAGTIAAMKDDETLDFLEDRGKRAKYVTSVCTGSLLLGQAGLLKNRKATSHWVARHILSDLGATPVNERVVVDGNVITGAGVSAGLDFALILLTKLRSADYAKIIQLQAEYAPAPVYNAGTPEAIGPRLAEPMQGLFSRAIYNFQEATKKRRQ